MRTYGIMNIVAAGLLVAFAAGCGTFTGIPSHGGGKRFAVEQELISASARAAAKDINAGPLVGRRCAVYVVSIGDEGAGNIIGGRYEWQAALRGEYLSSPTTRTRAQFPVVPTTTTTTTGNVVTTTEGESAINFPERTRSEISGTETRAGAGLAYSGPGTYRAEAFINPMDAQFLRAVLHEALALRGVLIVSPDRAEVDIYVTVDVFGTHRRRTEFHAYNEERLLAKTALQITAFDRDRAVVLPPQTVSWEAEYIEKYIVWMGPFRTDKQVRRSNDLLVSFRDIIPPPALDGVDEPLPLPAPPDVERTRPVPPITPLPAPDPARPEDVQ